MDKREIKNSFFEAFEKYNDDIFRFCFFKLSDRELARDLTQRSFEKAWVYMSQGNEIHNMRAFLYRTAKFLIIDEYRKKDRVISLDQLQEKGFEKSEDFNQQEIDNSMELEKVYLGVQKLPQKYQEVVTLKYVNDYPVKTIAEMLGRSENSISVQLIDDVQEVFTSALLPDD